MRFKEIVEDIPVPTPRPDAPPPVPPSRGDAPPRVQQSGDITISGPDGSDFETQTTDSGLQEGPPYPPEDVDMVKAVQTKLEQLGYSVGLTGIDGKYGYRTAAAIAAFKKDNNIAGAGSSISRDEIAKLNNATPVENPTPVRTTDPTRRPVTPVTDLTPDENLFNGPSSNRAAVRFNNPGAMYPASWQSRFGGTDTRELIVGGHRIAMFPDKVSGAAALFALLDGRLYRDKSVASALRTWTGGNSTSSYVTWLQGRGIDTDETVANFLANEDAAVALGSAMARWETGHVYPMSEDDWRQAYSRSGV